MNSMGYIQSGGSSSDDLRTLSRHPLIQEYAAIDGELYELIKATNKTLLLFVNLAKEICEGGAEE